MYLMESTYDISVHFDHTCQVWMILGASIVLGSVILLGPLLLRFTDSVKAYLRASWIIGLPTILLFSMFYATLLPVTPSRAETAASVEQALLAEGYSSVSVGELPDPLMESPTLMTLTKDGVKRLCSGQVSFTESRAFGGGGWVWQSEDVPATLKVTC